MLKVLRDDRLGETPRFFVGDGRRALMRVPDEILSCVVYVGIEHPLDDLLLLPLGTAFALTVPSSGQFSTTASYLVTARHVVVGASQRSQRASITIRVNMSDGGTRAIRTSLSDWFFHPTDTAADIAVLPLRLATPPYDLRHIHGSMAATPEVIEREGVGVGDEIFAVGLFVNHAGRKRNTPILRTGNIAMMNAEPIATPAGDEEVILIEARSIGGLSGSPAFVNTSGVRQGKVVTGEEDCVFWLGVVTGHWEGELEADVAVQDNRVNRGIGIVAPAQKVLEVIAQDALIARRKEAEASWREANEPTRD
jgi:hypothetical protein